MACSTNGIDDLSHLVSSFFVNQLAEDPVLLAGPRRPIADPGQPIEELSGLSPARLDAVMAAGFGLDLKRLQKTADDIGIVAALTETEVPVAEHDIPLVVTADVLKNSLQREVIRLAEIAVPRGESAGEDRLRDALDDMDDRLRGVTAPEGEDD